MRVGHVSIGHSDLFANTVHLSQVIPDSSSSLLFYEGSEGINVVQLAPVEVGVLPDLKETSSYFSYHRGCIISAGQHHAVQ